MPTYALTAPKLLVLGLVSLLLAGGTACGKANPTSLYVPPAGPVEVVVTVPVFADLVKQVGGERVRVTSVLPPGADVQQYNPSEADKAAMRNANIIFVNGQGLESFIDSVVLRNYKQGSAISILSGAVAVEDVAHKDKWLWLDVQNAMSYVTNIKDTLALVDPPHKSLYRQNASAYLDKLRALHNELKQGFASIPESKRKLVSLRDSFRSFAQAYGFEVVGSLDAASTSGGRTALEQAIKALQVPVLFTEPGLDRAVADSIAADTGVRVSSLYVDTLDAQVATYEQLMRFDLKQLLEQLR